MRILIVTNDFRNFNNFRKPLVNQLKKKGYSLIVLCNLNKKKVVKDKIIKFHNINFKSDFNFFNDFLNISLIFFYFFKYKPQISFNFTIKPILFVSCIAKLYNTVCINTVTGLGNLYLKSKKFQYYFEKLYKIFTSRNNYFFFHNSVDLNLFCKKKISLKEKSYLTKGSGVNLDYFKKIKPKFKKKIRFIMVSRLIYNKGVIEFLEAVNLLKKNKNLYFEIIGKERDEELNEISPEVLRKYKKLSNLKIKNYNNNIKSNLKKSNFVILPSYREGMPKTLMEAMSLGIPVIGSKVPGISELVINNFNGFFCESKNVNSLYRVILRVSKIDKKRYSKISNNCRKYSEKYLDEKKVVLKYLNLVNKIYEI